MIKARHYKLSYTSNQNKHIMIYTAETSKLTFLKESKHSGVIIKEVEFFNANQKAAFESAMEKKDLPEVLNIARLIEPIAEEFGEKMNENSHPARSFFSGYIAQQTNTNKFNQRFFVRHGLIKKKLDTTQFETKDHEVVAHNTMG